MDDVFSSIFANNCTHILSVSIRTHTRTQIHWHCVHMMAHHLHMLRGAYCTFRQPWSLRYSIICCNSNIALIRLDSRRMFFLLIFGFFDLHIVVFSVWARACVPPLYLCCFRWKRKTIRNQIIEKYCSVRSEKWLLFARWYMVKIGLSFTFFFCPVFVCVFFFCCCWTFFVTYFYGCVGV